MTITPQAPHKKTTVWTSYIDYLRQPLPRIAFVFTWLSRVTSAALIATPLLVVLYGALRDLPAGDRLLFTSGSVHLMEVVYVAAPALMAALRSSIAILGVTLLVATLPFAFLLSALADPQREVRACLRASLKQLATHALLWFLSWTLTAGIAFLGLLVVALSSASLAPFLNEQTLDITSLILWATVASAGIYVRILAQLSQCFVALGQGTLLALRSALRELTLHLRRTLIIWLLPQIAVLSLLALSAMVWSQIDLGKDSNVDVILALALQQLVIFGTCLCRVSWWSAGMTLARKAAPFSASSYLAG